MNNFNADALIKAGRQVKEPFVLSVTKEGQAASNISISRILRLLPAKRIVAVAEDGDRLVLVKIFIGRFSARYARREAQGIKSIDAAGVLTPRVEWQGRLAKGGGYVIAFEYLSDARNLLDDWMTAEDLTSRRTLIADAMPVLARLHHAGVVQNDIHPENFLINDGRIYTIDGGAVTLRSSGPLGPADSLDNLALFFAQFHARFDKIVVDAFDIYCRARNWVDAAPLCSELESIIHKKRKLRKDQHIEKAFRECTRFSCSSHFTRFTVCERKYDTPQLRSLLADPDAAMAAGKILKDGNTATVAVVDAPEGKFVIKRYNIKNFQHRLERVFRKSRAWVSWANTFRLEFLGINTLQPVALVEERFGPLRGRAYFVTRYIDGPDATKLVEKENPHSEMSSIVEILKSLSEAGLTHGDLKASNFLLPEEGAVIIDLDSLKEHGEHSNIESAERRDRERFMRNWQSSPNIERGFAELLG